MERFSFSANPLVRNVACHADGCRVSVITPGLIRVETGSLTDLPTQAVWNRDLGEVCWEQRLDGELLHITTERASFCVDCAEGAVRSVRFPDGTLVTDFQSGNLLGTARTLDNINGAVALENGVLSRSGASMMDDSHALLLGDNGAILPRERCTDLYYFAYGHDYAAQMRDYFRLTGPVPLIPKYALGNWWSRFKDYTQEEYRQLMQEFADRKLPITVATIDMDWHWTDVVERFGEEAKAHKPQCKEEEIYNTLLHGWTGYSWNTELFPDHAALLRWLHEHGLHVTVNVHPSQGIRFFEDCYEAMCRRMGRDPGTREPILFDITDPAFITAYFDEAHRPFERSGVDFWWLDWQQGTQTKVPGLDPLWALNHYHTLDNRHSGKRPLILSRFAGLGSHRYPLGFSGDTIVTWESLDFQPYFTNTAANAGYTWWSHDIGGHMKGRQDDELYLRWLQYGVFSPINRLHSSNSEFMGKEPWKKTWAVQMISEEFLRLRHRLIPYLYTANYQTHTLGTPLCCPLYYRYDVDDAYNAPNEYIFGGQLLVGPITSPMDKRLNLASVNTWLPEGRWTDLFTGRIYRGGQWVRMYRDLDAIPVLAGEGAIVPMYRGGEQNDLSLSQSLDIHIWRGNGSYDLYEDDGETTAFARGICAVTHFEQSETGSTVTFAIAPPADSHGLLPAVRRMHLRLRDIVDGQITVNGSAVPFTRDLPLDVGSEPIRVEITQIRAMENESGDELRSAILTRVQGSNNWKQQHLTPQRMPAYIRDALSELDALL